MLRNWWEPVPEETKVEDMLPFAALIDNEIIQLKTGHASMVYSIKGRDYTGLSSDELKQLHADRTAFVRFLEPHISVSIFSKRIREEDESSHNEIFDNEIAEEINKEWSKQFETSYRTRHYVVLTTTNPGMIDQLAADSGETKKDRQIINLREAAQKTEQRLSQYHPRRLKEDDLVSFWASHINGREVRQTTAKGYFSEMLAGANVLFPEGKKYMVFESSKDRYAAWIGIKAYEGDSTEKVIEELLHQKAEFTIYQNWRTMGLGAINRMLADKERMTKSFMRSGIVAMAEIEEATTKVEAGDITFCRYVLGIQVFGNSPAELEANVGKLEAIIEHHSYRTIRETAGIELLFWSALPGMDHLAVRRRDITNDNVADFVSFSTIGEGWNSCSWGDTYVTKFLTLANTEYRFIWHEDDKPQALGHTLIFGGSSSGKTTLATMLFSQSLLKFPDLKMILFDKLHGVEVFTKTHGGRYSDFGYEVDTNPFQMPDTPQNRAFLKEMIKNLVEGAADIDEEVITLAIRDNYENLKKEERCLNNIFDSFGLDAKGTMARALRSYVLDGDNASYFNGSKDSLNFDDSRITSFNMDSLFDNPKMLAQMALYIFYRIRDMAAPGRGKRKATPHLIFVDELVAYLEDPIFAKNIRKLVLEERKIEGIFVGALQDPTYFTKNPAAEGLLGSIANFIFFPDSKADKEAMMDKCGLTQEEANWVRTYSGGDRKILLKRRTGESVILNVDLSCLGKYLNVFNSSADAVGRLNAILEEGGSIKDYINGDA